MNKEKDVSEAIVNRSVLAEMIVDFEENGYKIKTIIVEKQDRVACDCDLMIQETIIQDFRENGVSLISAMVGADLSDNDPTRKLSRQILGAIAEYEKSMVVQKLRMAHQRRKAKTGKCEGQKSYREAVPKTVAYIKRPRRKPKGLRRKSYREIADQLNNESVLIAVQTFAKLDNDSHERALSLICHDGNFNYVKNFLSHHLSPSSSEEYIKDDMIAAFRASLRLSSRLIWRSDKKK